MVGYVGLGDGKWLVKEGTHLAAVNRSERASRRRRREAGDWELGRCSDCGQTAANFGRFNWEAQASVDRGVEKQEWIR